MRGNNFLPPPFSLFHSGSHWDLERDGDRERGSFPWLGFWDEKGRSGEVRRIANVVEREKRTGRLFRSSAVLPNQTISNSRAEATSTSLPITSLSREKERERERIIWIDRKKERKKQRMMGTLIHTCIYVDAWIEVDTFLNCYKDTKKEMDRYMDKFIQT